MTLEQIAMMAAAAKTLKEGGAYGADFHGKRNPDVHLPVDAHVRAVASIGIPVHVTPHPGAAFRYWRATTVYQGVAFFALYEPDQLPAIGYRLVDGRPVPITDAEVR